MHLVCEGETLTYANRNGDVCVNQDQTNRACHTKMFYTQVREKILSSYLVQHCILSWLLTHFFLQEKKEIYPSKYIPAFTAVLTAT